MAQPVSKAAVGVVDSPNRILQILKATFSIAKNHKKKTILLVFILSLYALWKFKHKIPYQKVISKVMGKIMQAMDKQMKHQQFVESCNVVLTLSLKEFDKSLHLVQLQSKYGKLFKLEDYRNELRANTKTLSKEKKLELWQNIVDEVIVFVFFFLITTRQTSTLNLLQKTLVAKYKDDFNKIIGIDETNARNFHLLDQILNEYCQTHIDHSIGDTLKFLRSNLNHDIKPTDDYDFFELQKKIDKIFQTTVFSKIVQKQDSQGSSSSHLTSSVHRPVEKTFFAPHDPTYEKPSIITRTVESVRGIGKFLLPNMFPEEATLHPTNNRYEILNILFNSTKQENIAEMNSNKIISSIFKQNIVNSNESNSNQIFEEEIPDDLEEQKQQSYSVVNKFEKVIDLRKLQNSNVGALELANKQDQISAFKIDQAKAFCSLIFKELRDILDMSSLHSYFYYSSLFQMRKFMNRLLLLLQKKNELNKKLSFPFISKYFDKLIVEEFLKADCEDNNEGFYQVRLKKCFILAKNVKNNNNTNNNGSTNNSEDAASHSTDAMSNPNKSEQDLISSGENQLIQSSIDNVVLNDPLEYRINLSILQEIEQHHLIEDSLQELIKRILFEREKTTVPIETKPANNQNAQAPEGGAGDLSGLFSLLGGGGLPGSSAPGGTGDLMSLLSNI